MIRSRNKKSSRRGAAVLGFVTALLVIGTLALWLLQMTATSAASSLTHYYSMGAFYAAESGAEMAMRELNQSPATDTDSDGTIGTISNDGNTSNDPTLVTGAVYVSKVNTSPPRYRATGRPVTSTTPWTNYRRVLEFETE